ncbi:MAG: 7-carboxy-7-deazaguanine synthase QueE [Candidatus Latescibacteria bacterium]|nr:7-carboxy-7-deazaguanine synthase QueE [Candidatus Latescibacterota bacterium]
MGTVPDTDTPAPGDPGWLGEICEAPRELLPVRLSAGEPLQVNEIFYSIEGEGLRVGQPTTFVRLSRCNLRCAFCDTDFDRHKKMTVGEILAAVGRFTARWVSLTGGEPLGQNIVPLCRELRAAEYRIQVETNGTLDPDLELLDLIDHWTVSPKRRQIAPGLRRITELKYIVGETFTEDVVDESRAETIYLQPESNRPEHLEKALEILIDHPDWRLSCRIHRMLGLR